ncbi:uncharacterized protein LOC124414871 isoform X1 [Diprion similis]|uniref:uncharacterized protein LOC124414871 isoform X1 n=1 Tax=Diprion similis TaxID=362088 RepID=UPI001EF8B2F2|nr:uncharacterized protein LOC124414871 isoform X1 [Diprion similis]
MRYSGVLSYAVLTLNLHFTGQARGSGSCKDLQGRFFESGFHYSPGPDACTLCVCDNGNPKWCKAVLCSQPQDCKSFRVGTTCCEFICMDDTLPVGGGDGNSGIGGGLGDGNTSSDMGLRLVASCITAILSLSLIFFLIHRLRQRKIRVCVAGRQNRQLTDEQRSLGSMGYLERGGLSHGGPADDMSCGGGYPLWKPPGNYFPRGEAPPPYEEAVAAARAEQALLSTSPHALSPLNFPGAYLSVNHGTHPSSVATVANSQIGLSVTTPNLSDRHGASTSPMIPSMNRPLSSPNTHSNTYQVNQGESMTVGAYANSSVTTFNIGPNTYENLPPPPGIITNQTHVLSQSNILSLPTSHSTIPKAYHQHTTLPRQGAGAFTISATLPTSGTSSHRTIPRTLATSGSLRLRREFTAHQSVAPLFDTPPRNVSPQNTPQSAPPTAPTNENSIRSDAFYDDVLVGLPTAAPQVEGEPPAQPSANLTNCDFKPKIASNTEVNQDGSIESVACACSMQALPTLHDDADDYRSECENCKSANGSRYYLDNQDELVTSPHETMTLHRRPEETPLGTAPQYYRTSLTLPTSTRQRTRSTGARENWFSSMPESSTESSDED